MWDPKVDILWEEEGGSKSCISVQGVWQGTKIIKGLEGLRMQRFHKSGWERTSTIEVTLSPGPEVHVLKLRSVENSPM